METIVLAYICAIIAWLFAFYISYLFIYKDLKFKKFIILIIFWGAYTHSPLLSAIDVRGLSDIRTYEAIIFYLLTIVTVVAGYALAYFLSKPLPSFVASLRTPPPPGKDLNALGSEFNPSLGKVPDRVEGVVTEAVAKGVYWIYLKVIAIMTLGEYLRGVILSILFLGANSTVGVSDATFSIANTLALTPLSRLAYFGHIYYLTFMLFLIIVVIFETHNRYKVYLSKGKLKLSKINYKELLKVIKPLILLFVFISLQLLYVKYVYYQYHTRQAVLNNQNIFKGEELSLSKNVWPQANILLIPSDIPMHYDMTNLAASTTFNKLNNDYQSNLDKIIKNINSNGVEKFNKKLKYDMVVLPENITYLESLNTSYRGIPILNGLLNSKEKNSHANNSSIYIDNKNGTTYRNKDYLFPFYEYKPYIAYLIPNSIYKKGDKIIPGDGVVDFYLEIEKSKEKKTEKSEEKNFESVYKWTTIICSEFYSYNYLKSLKARDYDFIISQSSLGIFNHSPWMHANVLMSQIINSNYLAVPIINISNSAPSYLIIDNEIKNYHEDYIPFVMNTTPSAPWAAPPGEH